MDDVGFRGFGCVDEVVNKFPSLSLCFLSFLSLKIP